MEFRRIGNIPPYVFAVVDSLKMEERRRGEDVIDLGFGNPDIPSPDIAVEKLCEAARNSKNHRYSSSRGIPKLRKAITDLYARNFGVDLDPEREAIVTIGAKEGLAHLMWVLAEPGDGVIVPSPSYPIHLFAPNLAGARVTQVELGPHVEDFFVALQQAYERSWPRARAIITSFPHNPTTYSVDKGFFERLVEFAKKNDVFLVHDFAYADIYFDGYRPPSLLEVPGAKDVGVELYTLTKSFSMPGWRVGFVLGNPEMIAALQKLKSYLDYGTFQPIQIASIVTMNEAPDYPKVVRDLYKVRRDVLCDGLERIAWSGVERPKGTMFVWAPIPEQYRHLGSVEFSVRLVKQAKVAVSPGVGFGPEGDGFVRFALVENEQRIGQGLRGIKRAFDADLALS